MIERYFEPGIVIERYTQGEDEWGEPIADWREHLNISGRIRPMTGNERFASERTDYFSDHRLYCGVQEIRETDRVKYKDEYYKIQFVAEPMNMGKFMQIDLEKRGVNYED